MSINLILGDCTEKLSEIKSDSVDLILTSPPYNMNLRINKGRYVSRQIVKEITTKYKAYDDNLPMESYYNLLCKVTNECLRISDLVFINIQQLTGNKPALYKFFGEYHLLIKELIVWDKINSQPAIRDGVLNSQFELIIILQKSNPKSRRFSKNSFNRGTLSNLWGIKREAQPVKELGAAFPLSLAEKVITNFTNVGDLVLDPFMGSGTTGVACVKNNRSFIGIELDEDYYQASKNRIFEAELAIAAQWGNL